MSSSSPASMPRHAEVPTSESGQESPRLSSPVFAPSLGYDGAADEADAQGSSRELAIRSDRTWVRVEATGRVPGQTMYMWASSENKTSAVGYKAETDGPAVRKCPINPTPLETEPCETSPTTKYIEVGLMHGLDPTKGASTTSGRQSGINAPLPGLAAMYASGAPRGENMMRVFAARTQHIAPHIKYYAGCLVENNRLHPRVVGADTIFFYAEVWEKAGIVWGPGRDNKEKRKVKLNTACRELASFTATHAASKGVVVVKDAESAPPKEPLVVTKDCLAASQLAIWFSMLKKTNDPSYIDLMINIIESDTPDLKFARTTSTEGYTAFLVFNEPLTDKEATDFEAEIQATFPNMEPITADCLKHIHEALRRPYHYFEHYGHHLQKSGLGFFLELCSTRARSWQGEDGSYDQNRVNWGIDAVLDLTKIHLRHCRIETFQPNPVHDLARLTLDDAQTGSDKFTDADHLQFLRQLQEMLENLHTAAVATVQAGYDEHGGVVRTQSMREFMVNASEVVDTAALKIHIKQLLVLNDARLRAALQPLLAQLGNLAGVLKTYRAYLPQEQGHNEGESG